MLGTGGLTFQRSRIERRLHSRAGERQIRSEILSEPKRYSGIARSLAEGVRRAQRGGLLSNGKDNVYTVISQY